MLCFNAELFVSGQNNQNLSKNFQKPQIPEARALRCFVKRGTSPDVAARVRASVINAGVENPVVRTIVPEAATQRAPLAVEVEVLVISAVTACVVRNDCKLF